MVVKQKIYKKNLIHHSDRGLQYCSKEYQNALKKKNIKPSMTEKNPYANAHCREGKRYTQAGIPVRRLSG